MELIHRFFLPFLSGTRPVIHVFLKIGTDFTQSIEYETEFEYTRYLMHIRKFHGRNIRESIERMRAEIGEEAVISPRKK